MVYRVETVMSDIKRRLGLLDDSTHPNTSMRFVVDL